MWAECIPRFRTFMPSTALYNLRSTHFHAQSMATIKDLIAQKEALEQQIETATVEGRNKAIEQVRALMAENGLSVSDLGSKSSGNSSRSIKKEKPGPGGAKVAAKYRNTATGESWSGRGLQPRWLKAALAGGKKIEDFAV